MSEMFDVYLQNLDRKGLATSTINSHDILLNILALVWQTRWQKVNLKYERENEVKASHFAVFYELRLSTLWKLLNFNKKNAPVRAFFLLGTKKHFHVIFHIGNAADPEVIHEDFGNVRRQECRERRAQMNIFDAKI